MLTFTIRRLILAIPTLLFISLVIFGLLQLAPGDPMAQVPLTVPPEVKQKMREALGLGDAWYIQYWKWIVQFFWTEPKVLFDWVFGTNFSEGQLRVLSWQTRSPVMDIVIQRIPQTLWVVGTAYVVAVLIALPIGIYSAYRQYSIFDNIGTFVSMIGFSVPPFFSGVLAIVVFSVILGWFPSIYDTTHQVTDWDSFVIQLRQMILPVMVLALQITAQIARFMRASTLDNLNQDYVRTARAKGLSERVVIYKHVLKNGLIPVVTILGLQLGVLLAGAIITEKIFNWQGLGSLLLDGINTRDHRLVQGCVLVISVTYILANSLTDLVYRRLDPRIRLS